MRRIIDGSRDTPVFDHRPEQRLAAADRDRQAAAPKRSHRTPPRHTRQLRLHRSPRVRQPRVGFAITDLPQAGDGTYPVGTADHGKTWRTDGPVLHVPAAQGPVAVGQAGVLGPKIYFAWCGACNMVIDVTPDAGKHWWQTFMPGNVLAVIGGTNPRAGLMAIVEGPTSAPNGRGASLWAYSSTDGRRWVYKYSLNAVS